VRYLRTGESGALLRAKAWADYRSDQAIIHTDDWTYAPEHEDRFPQFHVGNGGEIMATTGNFFDHQHRHTRGLPLMYYLTGKERYLDAIFEDAELVTFNDRMELHYLNTRVQSVLIRLAMNSWRFLGEVEPIVSIRDRSGFSRDELLSKAEAYMRAILDARFDFSRACSGGPQPKGWSDEPGESRNDSRRFWFAGGDRIRNREPKFHLIAMFPDMLWNYDRLARHDDPNRSEVRARILDLEHYFWNFLFTDCPEDAHRASIGDFFVFLFDDECRIPEVPQCFEGDDFHPAYQMEAFAFDVTGDPVHLERGIRFMLGQHYGGDQLVWGNAYRTGFLNFVYHFMHHEWDDVGPVLDEVESVKAEEFPVAVRWNTDEESSGHVIYWTDLDHRRVMAREGRIGTRHVVPLEDLIPVREYKYRVASQDESGNWSLSRRRILGFDDFRSDTRDRYDVIRSGGAVVEHDLATKMLRMGGGPGSVAEISLTRREGDSIGFCSLDFLPDSIPESGSITIRLMEDEDDFYELDLYADASGGEALRLRKVMDGTTVRSSRRGGAPFGRDRLRTKLVFRPDAFGIKEGGAHGFFGFRTPVGQRMIEVRKIVIIVRGIHGRLDNVLVELG